jgi:hypothetical protein
MFYRRVRILASKRVDREASLTGRFANGSTCGLPRGNMNAGADFRFSLAKAMFSLGFHGLKIWKQPQNP